MPERSTHRPAIVVAAFNRPASLSRLLSAISKGVFPSEPVTLHISIDKGPAADVLRVAEEFQWTQGEKVVEAHPENLGLKAHLLHCGSLAKRYGSTVLLEDDLFVAPAFYGYACEALDFHAPDERIAGVSLYHYEAAESCRLPFQPIETGTSCYFMQWTASWGQAWTAAQWESFEKWLAGAGGEVDKWLPEFVRNWESGSWKRLHIAYLRATGRYFVYPRASLSTHFGEAGTHSVLRGADQTNLVVGEPELRWEKLDESLAVYDAWFELLPEKVVQLQPGLKGLEFDVDLYGAKENGALEKALVLTSRRGENALRSYALDLLPPIANVVQGLEGEGIYLLKKSKVDFSESPASEYLSKTSGWHKFFLKSGEMQKGLRISVVILCEAGKGNVGEILGQLSAVQEVELEILWVGNGEMPKVDGIEIRQLAWPKAGAMAALELAFDTASGDLLYALVPGQVLPPNCLRDLHYIAQAYPDTQAFLLQPPGQPLPAQRWTRDRFARTRPEQLNAFLGPGMVLIRRSHWLKTQHSKPELPAYWAALFQDSLPIAVEVSGPRPSTILPAPSPEVQAHFRAQRSLPGRLLSRIFRPAFLRNSKLRWVHAQIEQYPPVIRRAPEKESGWDMAAY